MEWIFLFYFHFFVCQLILLVCETHYLLPGSVSWWRGRGFPACADRGKFAYPVRGACCCAGPSGQGLLGLWRALDRGKRTRCYSSWAFRVGLAAGKSEALEILACYMRDRWESSLWIRWKCPRWVWSDFWI